MYVVIAGVLLIVYGVKRLDDLALYMGITAIYIGFAITMIALFACPL